MAHGVLPFVRGVEFTRNKFQLSLSPEERNDSDCTIEPATCVDASISKDVKSTAVVKYSAVNTPANFYKLRNNTDLNLPPDDWLRENGRWQVLKGHWTSTGTDSTLFSSLQMAYNFPDCVGEVDVVSDAENIKQLLKIPYGNSQVSMMVHRIGKTLLLDDFDIHHHLLQAAKKEWEWLRKFFLEHILQTLHHKEKTCFRKNRSRCFLQDKNMLSKFLYYSIADIAASQDSLVPDPSCSSDDSQTVTSSHQVPATQSAAQADPVPLLEVEIDALNRDHDYQRNVLWTFEDIQMLIGTDMPIFGGRTHPCVSLRLRDITKPINVLTGLDYWLDNLMCNVPEVMMCYHLEGIVQKYELIKTEDIPKMDNSKFSPKVIKDIAQNILSFLKSNATKAGHTYWLFKAKDDDVIKLYDLTTLCADIMDDKEQNPFTVPVAMLLYRVAHNMKSSSPDKTQLETICTLLKNCLTLLNKRKYPQVATSAHYLLSDLYVPSSLDLTSLILPTVSESSIENHSGYPVTPDDDDDNGVRDGTGSSSVNVKALCRPELDSHNYMHASAPDPDLSGSLENRCMMALRHVEQGLTCLEFNAEEYVQQETTTGESPSRKNREEAQQQAKPFQPIPLHYESISSLRKSNAAQTAASKCDCEPMANMPLAPKANQWLLSKSWQSFYMGLLFQKASVSAYAMAKCLSDKKQGEALRYVELSLSCYDAIEQIVHSVSQPKLEETTLACCIFGLAGDIHFMLVQHSAQLTEFREQYEQFSNFEVIGRSCKDILNRECNYLWAVEFQNTIEDSMIRSAMCYQAALERAHGEEDKIRLRKRMGNIQNELGVFYMSQAHSIFSETWEFSDRIEKLWKLSSECLEAGTKIFEEIQDEPNIALLNSNLGRLMRLRALCFAQAKDSPKECTAKERSFYEKAISFYQKALRALGNKEQHASIRENISWDISSTYFTLASWLQDFAPLSVMSHEEVVKDISEFMLKALKYCDVEATGPRQPVYQFRVATIHHRLGSLNHHSSRNSTIDEGKKKQYRTLAEMHLLKAAKIFLILEDCAEYLKVQLERIGLWEFHFAGLLGNSAKLKCLHTILELIFESIPIVDMIKDQKEQDKDKLGKSDPGLHLDKDQSRLEEKCTLETDESSNEAENNKLLVLLHQRLQFALLNCMKIHSTKHRKGNDAVLSEFKKMYSESLKQPFLEDSFSAECFLQILVSIQTAFSSVKH